MRERMIQKERSPVLKSVFSIVLLGLSSGLCAQTPAPSSDSTLASPAVLPGNGLAQHDFLYAGESHSRRIYVIRYGEVVWNYDDPGGKGEISDAVMLSNGNILFA